MISTGVNLALRTNIPTVIEPKKEAVDTDTSDTPATDEAKAKEGVVVTISGAAMMAAKAEKTSNADIDESGLDEPVKQLLKLIRLIKQQIAEKQAELAAVMADKSLTPEQLLARIGGLQSALGVLQASLMSAQGLLAKAMKEMPAESAVKAANLAMK